MIAQEDLCSVQVFVQVQEKLCFSLSLLVLLLGEEEGKQCQRWSLGKGPSIP